MLILTTFFLIFFFEKTKILYKKRPLSFTIRAFIMGNYIDGDLKLWGSGVVNRKIQWKAEIIREEGRGHSKLIKSGDTYL